MMRFIQFLVVCSLQLLNTTTEAFVVPSNLRTRSVATTHAASLADYAPAAASLFNNMRTSASIIGGAMIPIGFAAPLAFDVQEGDSKFAIVLRKVYPLAAVVSLCSELLSVMWATVAVNQLTESKVAAASSVWALLQRDFALPWVATNAHFVLGMMGFIWVIASRAYFIAKQGQLGKSAAGMAFSSLFLMTSIVNRGVAAGGGEGGMRFGKTVLALFRTYASLLVQRACTPNSFGVMELAAVGTAAVCFVNTVRVIVQDIIKPNKSSAEILNDSVSTVSS